MHKVATTLLPGCDNHVCNLVTNLVTTLWQPCDHLMTYNVHVCIICRMRTGTGYLVKLQPPNHLANNKWPHPLPRPPTAAVAAPLDLTEGVGAVTTPQRDSSEVQGRRSYLLIRCQQWQLWWRGKEITLCSLAVIRLYWDHLLHMVCFSHCFAKGYWFEKSAPCSLLSLSPSPSLPSSLPLSSLSSISRRNHSLY